MAEVVTAIDHLAVAAGSIQAGVEYVRQTLGVDIPEGGVHPHMGTHNHLMRLGNGKFLEVIAIDPNGQSPSRPRWFGLDDPMVRQSICERPRLVTWVANTSDLEAATSSSLIDYGEISELSRGELRWSFSLPEDGRLLASGMMPYLMQWHCDFHPSERMADCGCTLKSLTIRHAASGWLRNQLSAICADKLVTLESLPAGSVPELRACVATPSGEKWLSSSL